LCKCGATLIAESIYFRPACLPLPAQLYTRIHEKITSGRISTSPSFHQKEMDRNGKEERIVNVMTLRPWTSCPGMSITEHLKYCPRTKLQYFLKGRTVQGRKFQGHKVQKWMDKVKKSIE
jgi:hypothetical protein